MKNTMTSNQLELSFQPQGTLPTLSVKKGPSRSEWWFTQMRRVVDLAMEWKPTPVGRPEQGRFELQTRRV